MKATNATMGVVQYVVFSCDELFIVDKSLLCNVNLGKDFDYHIFGPSCWEIKEW
jgi:hypothetical protein